MKRLFRRLWNGLTALAVGLTLVLCVIGIRGDRWSSFRATTGGTRWDIYFSTSLTITRYLFWIGPSSGGWKNLDSDQTPRVLGSADVVDLGSGDSLSYWQILGLSGEYGTVHLFTGGTHVGHYLDEADTIGPIPRQRIRVSASAMLMFLLPLPLTRGLFSYWGWKRRRNRSRSGLCAACGYDLRATPAKCPECGRELLGTAIC